jgi:hypothetical protein
MNPIHDKFTIALERIQTALNIADNPTESYMTLLWDDLDKYWSIDASAVLWSLEDFRTHSKYKSYPKIGDLVPLIEKRIFPNADDAFHEATQYVGDKEHEWSHDVVHYTAIGTGQVRLKTGTKGIAEIFAKRYQDTIDQFIGGRVFAFDTVSLPDVGSSDMGDIDNWIKLQTNSAGHPIDRDLYYLTKMGSVAVKLKKDSIARMKTQAWWAEHIKIHGEEPSLPKIAGYDD